MSEQDGSSSNKVGLIDASVYEVDLLDTGFTTPQVQGERHNDLITEQRHIEEENPILVIEQLALEHQSRVAGHQRYIRNLKKAGESIYADGNKGIVEQGMSDMADAIIQAREAVHPKSKPEWFVELEGVDEWEIAAIAGHCAQEAIAGKWKRQRFMKSVGTRLQTHINIALVRAQATGQFKYWEQKAIEKFDSPRKRELSILGQAKFRGFNVKDWTDVQLTRIGGWVYGLVMNTKVFKEVRHKKWKNGKFHDEVGLGLTKEASDELAELRQTASWLRPYYSPMISKPEDWSHYQMPYRSDETNRTIKHFIRNATDEQMETMNRKIRLGEAGIFLNALNTMQSTAFELNETVAELVRWAWLADEDDFIEGMPRRKHYPELDEAKYDLSTPELIADFNDQRAEISEQNDAIDNNRQQMMSDYCVIRYLRDTKKEVGEHWTGFFVPMSVCTRGRFTPIPGFNYQRGDHIRSMFNFSSKQTKFIKTRNFFFACIWD